VFHQFEKSIPAAVAARLSEQLQIDAPVHLEQPRDSKFGEFALPVAFQLARQLKQAPKVIAERLVNAIGSLPGVAAIEIAGNGYLNVRLDRAAYLHSLMHPGAAEASTATGKIIIEHTNINPNKAAHIGHLRNAILGDTFVRMLRASGEKVEVQNYIDNTGVQVADVVVGFKFLERKSLAEVEALAAGPRFDYYCWDLYAQTSSYYKEHPESLAWRAEVLHSIEAGTDEVSRLGHLVADAIVKCHLRTMARLDIAYDVLPRESEILHLHFWETARALMVEKGVLYLETEGKNKGCWVMRRAISAAAGVEAASEGPDEDAKIIIRSNGTVTYVGKDFAYHLWKYGLLGKDFGYARFREYATHVCWVSTMKGEDPHPSFGHADAIYNVIDSRQDDPQAQVKEALRSLGYRAEADRYTHLNYAFVGLTARTAVDLGYTLSEEDTARNFIEVSGRKGFGVKADDLIDRMIAAARAEVDARHPELSAEERGQIAEAIGVGALRFFLLRFTRNTIIAFDYQDALAFDGETGPYAQYAAVRAANIFRKAGVSAEAALAAVATLDLAAMLEGEEGTSVWEVWLTASRLSLVLEQAIAAAEPAMLARYAFTLAQQFNNFYHRHHILTETDGARKMLLLATAAVARRELVRVLGWLGITVPSAM
jgi:arginyl-tRNA synthetase